MWLKLENTDELSSFALTIFKDIKHLSERVSDIFFIFTEKELSGHWLNWKDERFSFCKEEHLDYNINKKKKKAGNFVNWWRPDMSWMEKLKEGTGSEHIFRSL